MIEWWSERNVPEDRSPIPFILVSTDCETSVFVVCSNDGQEFGGSIYHQIDDKLETGIQLAWEAGSNNTRLGIGCKYQFDKDASMRVKVNNSSQIGLGYTQKLRHGNYRHFVFFLLLLGIFPQYLSLFSSIQVSKLRFRAFSTARTSIKVGTSWVLGSTWKPRKLPFTLMTFPFYVT